MDESLDFRLDVPPDVGTGTYANFLVVWHTAYEFTLDFCCTEPPRPATEEDPDASLLVPCRVVARVKIPPPLAFEVLHALNRNMTQYESVFGEIHGPEIQEGE